MVWCGVNGVGLALVIPCVQSLTADYNPAEMRGRAFGIMAFTAAMGVPRLSLAGPSAPLLTLPHTFSTIPREECFLLLDCFKPCNNDCWSICTAKNRF